MVGFSGISFEDQMLEFERRAREDAMRREEDKQRARDRVAALAAAQARQEAEAKARAATAAAALADAERRAATKREADIASARARDEAAAQVEAELQARRPAPGPLQATPTPRLSELLGGAGPTNPPVAARPTSVSRSTTTPRATTTSRPVSPPADRSVRPGGLEVAALELAEGGDLRAHNAARRRAFDAVPGGAETRAAIELAAAATSPSRLTADAEERLFASALAQEEAAAVAGPPSVLRQVREALNEDDKRMREAKIRDVASTVPLGLETLDAFRLERELDAREAVVRSELDEPGHPDAVPPALRRAPLPSSGTEPTSDFEAFASFSESGRRQAAAVDAVQRATGAASAREVADDLEEQSALDAAFRREMLADPGGADAVRAMDAEAADLEAMQRLEMVADPGGAAVLKARERRRPEAAKPELPVVAYRTVTYDLFAEDLGGEDGPINKAFDFGSQVFDSTITGQILNLVGIDDLSFGLIPGLPTYELFTHRVIVTQLQDANGDFRTEVRQVPLNEEAGWNVADHWVERVEGKPTEHLVYAHYDVEGLSPFESSTADVAITVVEAEGAGLPQIEQKITWNGVLRPEILTALESASERVSVDAPMSEVARKAGYPELADLLDSVSPASVRQGVISFAYDRYVDAAPGLSAKPRPLQISPWITVSEEAGP